jgi:hypothetical protein
MRGDQGAETQARTRGRGARKNGSGALMDYWQSMAKMMSSAWAPDEEEQRKAEETTRRLGQQGASLMSAEAGLAYELMRAPLWFLGGASPERLTDQYERLLDESRNLWLSAFECASDWQRSFMSRTDRATSEARDAVSSNTEKMKDAAERQRRQAA